MRSLIPKAPRTLVGATTDASRGQRVHLARQRLLHPSKPVVPAAANVLPIPVSPPPNPLLFRMGTDLATGREVLLRPERFEHQPHMLWVGAPGTGKTTKMLNMLDSIISDPDATLFVLNPKGGFGRKVRDLVIARGQAHRLEILDPGEQRYIASYNPAHPNSLTWAVHAKQLREEIRASNAMSSFDVAQQMARILFMFLAAVRLLNFTLAEAVELLRPRSQLRKAVIPKISDPYLRESLTYFHSLPERRQEELSASSLARLESFVFDPQIRHIIAQQGPSLDMGEIIEHRKIFIGDIRESDPLRTDDARLLGRFLTNDVVAACFSRLSQGGPVMPVHLVIDEAPSFMTDDLARAIDKGREPGLRVWLACQYPDQFILEDGNTRIRDSVMKCIEHRILFRLPDVDDAKYFASQLFFDRYSPLARKYSRQSVETEPVETTRIVQGSTHTLSKGEAIAYPRSRSVGTNQSDTEGSSTSVSVGTNETWNTADTRGTSITEAEAQARMLADTQAHTSMDGVASTRMQGKSHTDGQGEMDGEASAHGEVAMATDASSLGYSYDSPFAVLPSTYVRNASAMNGSSTNDSEAENHATNRFRADGTMEVEGETLQHADALTTARTVADTLSTSRARTLSESHTEGHALGTSLVHTTEASKSHTVGTSDTTSEGVTPSVSREESNGESQSVVPFISFIKRTVEVDIQFLSEEEQTSLNAQIIHRLPNRHYLLQLAMLPTRCMREPDWTPPTVTPEELEASLVRDVYAKPHYPPVEIVEAKERERNKTKTKAARSKDQSKESDTSSADNPRPAFW